MPLTFHPDPNAIVSCDCPVQPLMATPSQPLCTGTKPAAPSPCGNSRRVSKDGNMLSTQTRERNIQRSTYPSVTDNITPMINGFHDRKTEAVFNGIVPKGFPADIAAVARRKLAMVNAAFRLDDLKSPPGNRLEALKGDRAGQYSIRVNDQWRVCFVWADGHASRSKSWITTDQGGFMDMGVLAGVEADFSDLDSGERIPPVTPGNVLLHEFMEPLGLSARKVAADMDMPPNRVTGIIRGERGVTAATAIALGKRFDTSAEFWMNLQVAHDLETARSEMRALLVA